MVWPSGTLEPAGTLGYHTRYQPQGCAIPIGAPLWGAPIGTLRALDPDARLLWRPAATPVPKVWVPPGLGALLFQQSTQHVERIAS